MQQLVGERYRLDTEIGTGGTAVVWLAWDLITDRPRALKLLLPVSGPGAEERRERMRAEARALASLDHPHVVRVFDQGVHEGRDYIVMEYAEGGSLADELAREGPLAPHRALQLMRQVLDALAAAHDAGMVHRDVKPANVLLRGPDEAALSDFGIARIVQASGTRTGVALGSVGFMAPEQRLDARAVGPAADLYGVACTLFNLVTQDTPVDLYLAPPHSPRWSDVPVPLREILRRATQADPTDRHHSASEMKDELLAVSAALEGLPPARRRRLEAPDTYIPTSSAAAAEAPSGAVAALREPAPRLTVGGRPPRVGPHDWRAVGQHRPGRTALWLGVVLVMVLTAAGLAGRPLLDPSSEPPGPAPSSTPAVPTEADAGVVVAPVASEPEAPTVGEWRGNLDGERPLVLVLGRERDQFVARMSLRLGTHEGRSVLRGELVDGALELEEPAGLRLSARPSAHSGVWVGQLWPPRADVPVPFAIVWVGPPADTE